MDEEAWRNLIKVPYLGSFAWIRNRRNVLNSLFGRRNEGRRVEDKTLTGKLDKNRRR